MLNKLVKSISGVFNKWVSLDTEDKLYFFILAACGLYAALNLILLIQYLWWMYAN